MGASEGDIRAAGLRRTAQRIAVLDILRAERRHYRADELSSRVRERLGSVSTQAVYDALEALVAARLARRIELAGSAARFEARTADNHHHVVCRGCGAVVDVDCAIGAAPCHDVPEAPGFVIDEAEITFWGRCRDCEPAAAPAGAPITPVSLTERRRPRGLRQPPPQTGLEEHSDTSGGMGGRHRQ